MEIWGESVVYERGLWDPDDEESGLVEQSFYTLGHSSRV